MDRDHTMHGIPVVPPDPQWRPWALAAAVFAVTLIVFLPALSCGFVNLDDDQYVYRNPVVLGGLTPANVATACTRSIMANWAPLTILSYQVDVTLFGREPWGFHLTNIILHAAACSLLFLALARMTAAPVQSAVAAVLYGIHPLRVESVAWISERKDVLSVLFLAATLLAYEWYTRRPTVGRSLAVMAGMAASLASKATLVTLPVLLLVCDFWPLGRIEQLPAAAGDRDPPPATPRPSVSLLRAVLEKAPLMAVAMLATAITVIAQGGALEGNSRRSLFGQRLPNAVFGTGWYLWRLVAPVNLCPFYSPIDPARDAPLIVVSAAAILAVVAIAARFIKRQPAIAWGVAWFFVSLAPVSQIVQTGSHGYADRYSYVPHIGLVVAVVFSLAEVARRWGIPSAITLSLAATVAVALGVTTVRQIGIWRDAGTLWRHTLAVDATNGVALYHFATHLRETGEPDAAIRQLERSSACWAAGTAPARIQLELGLARLDAGRPVEAAKAFEAALEKEPGNWKATNGLGVSWLHRGQPQRALDCFEQVLRLEPDEPDTIHNAMLALVAMGRLDDAATSCRRLIALDPAAVDPRSRLGQILLRLGRLDAAIHELEVAVRLDPGNTGVQTVLAEAYAVAGQRERAASIARAALANAREPLAPAIRRRLERAAAAAMPAP
jgi:tetratricopeptide (TPR) repeat protein